MNFKSSLYSICVATFCQAFKLNTKRAYGFDGLKGQAGFQTPIDTKGLGILGRLATGVVRPNPKGTLAPEKAQNI